MRLADLLDGSVPERGDRGPVVTALQEYLRADGFDVGVDGIFGVQTARTVRLWQFLHFGLERGDLLHVWSALRLMRAEQRRIGFDDFDELVAWVAVCLLVQDIEETSQNRGPWVDVIVALGGGDPEDAAPWCARFVVACRRLAAWLWRLDGEPGRAYPRTGSAARTWLDTPARDRLLKGTPGSSSISRATDSSRSRAIRRARVIRPAPARSPLKLSRRRAGTPSARGLASSASLAPRRRREHREEP